MVEDPRAAIANARRALAAGGEVVIVDFADGAGLPRVLQGALRRFLRSFHVEPLDAATLGDAASVRHGPARYYLIARLPALPQGRDADGAGADGRP
jgi:hypothetical protein